MKTVLADDAIEASSINEATLASDMSVELHRYMSTPLTIEKHTTCEELIALFKQYPESECVVLVDRFNRPITLFMRNALFMKFSRRYSSDLFFEKPVTVLVDEPPLILDITTSPELIIQSALKRPQKSRYDCVLLVANHVLQGIMTLANILELSNELQKYAKYEQSVLLEKAVGYVHHIADQMKAVELEILQQQKSFNTMIDFTLQGKNLLLNMLRGFEQINYHTTLQNQHITTMKQDSIQLKKIALDVVDLSEQSNILALNATIEAAKAKEHGLAFNVVANEVRGLSQKTKGSVTHIQQVVQTMLALISQNESISQTSIQLTQENKTTINQTEEVFKSIFEALAEHQKEFSALSKQAQQVAGLTTKTKIELSVLSEYIK